MSKDKTYDPFESFKQISEMWERQVNGLLYMMTDNKEFVRTANIGLDAYSRYMELLRRNQDFLSGLMNIPTKKDMANVANLSIQAEEKMDSLEEQIWKLQDLITSLTKDNLDSFTEMVHLMKQMKNEFQKTAAELEELKNNKADLKEIRQAVVEIRIMQTNLQEMRNDLDELKDIQTAVSKERSNETNHLQTDIEELKTGMNQLTDIKKEIAALKNWMKKEKEKEKELALTGAGTSK
jgi:DNA repair exonuclease SbcCD ATPase subunit